MLAYSEPPGYRRTAPIRRPKLDAFTSQMDQWLAEDRSRPRKQRHTAKRIFERLRDECGFDGSYTIVKDYVRDRKRTGKEMFVPLSHPPGHAQADFGEALVVMGVCVILCPDAFSYAMGKRSSNMMASWLLTRCHSRTDRFHSAEVALSAK